MHFNYKKPIILVLFTLLCLTTGFCLGVFYNQEKTQPQEIMRYIEIERIVSEPVIRVIEKPIPTVVEIPVEVPVEVEVEHVIEKTVTVPVELNDFATTEELERWLNSRPEPILTLYNAIYDCEDVARQMIDAAMDDGYYMWIQVVEGPYYSPISHELLCQSGEAHALCSVIIDNGYYFIEPSEKEYWMAYNVD